MIKNGGGIAEVKQIEFGSEAAFQAATGYEDVTIGVTNATVTTTSFTKFGFSVPVTAKYPEAAVAVLNLMYSDQEFIDTLAWGVEGVDWVKNSDGMACYPDGITADNVQYHTADFLYGDRLMVTPWEGVATDIREQQKSLNAQMKVSPFLGFCVDSSNVANEVTSCVAVLDRYRPALTSGTAEDVEAAYKEFIDNLYAAGMQTIIDEYQSQLDEWLSHK